MPSNMSNMDEFNKATADILSKLYENFPRRLSIQSNQFAEGGTDAGLYGDTILFLEKEGIVSFESRAANTLFNGLTLTSKGLAALNSKPDVLEEKSSTLGQKLGNAAKQGSKEALTTLVNIVIETAVTGFIRAHAPNL